MALRALGTRVTHFPVLRCLTRSDDFPVVHASVDFNARPCTVRVLPGPKDEDFEKGGLRVSRLFMT